MSYAVALTRRSLDYPPFTFYLRINIGLFDLIYSISVGIYLASVINYISSNFLPLDVLVASRKYWWFMLLS